jgi:hypothetical protein
MPSNVYGFVEAIFVLGMIIGGLLITMKPKLFTMKVLHKTMYPMIIAIIIMAISTNLNKENIYLILGLYSIGGLGIMLSISLSNIISLTYIQNEVRQDMLGKVSAFSTAVATISVSPGQILYGQLLECDYKLLYILIGTVVFSLGAVWFIKWNVRKIKCNL